jgi:hypothetical protein
MHWEVGRAKDSSATPYKVTNAISRVEETKEVPIILIEE